MKTERVGERERAFGEEGRPWKSQHFEELVLGTAVFKASFCGFLITKEQFITPEINEEIKAVKGKQAFSLYMHSTQVLLLTPK